MNGHTKIKQNTINDFQTNGNGLMYKDYYFLFTYFNMTTL